VEAARRTLGVDLYDTQLMAARIMLDGHLAEMATGEGKTLAISLGAAAAALAGVPVHVMTANDYLVGRDAAALSPLYAALGLTVGTVLQSQDARERRLEYARDITYCTAKELAFDYLRDGIARGKARSDLEEQAERLCGRSEESLPVLRGLCMALVDEADNCLIDDASVPMILARPVANPDRNAYFASALDCARRMDAPQDFALDPAGMRAQISESGCARLVAWAAALPPVWRNRLHREETIATALAALHLYQRDRHYLVRDGKVAMIDPGTGRIAEGRSWSGGLHQMIELKEGCSVSTENETCAQITFQRLFRRYWRLGGMSGTLREARGELRKVYDLQVVPVPLRRPNRLNRESTRLYPDRERQFNAVLERTREQVASGRPVLIGTDSVADSHALSQRLTEAGIAHRVLNAHHEAAEAQIIGKAGTAGSVTVTTNMAGRGTDVSLGPGVAQQGGLTLICCQHNASRRIDRQLIGRCARHGDPGTAVTLLNARQPLIAAGVPEWVRRRLPLDGLVYPALFVALLVGLPQWMEERRQRASRRTALEQDEAWDRSHPTGATAE
jgi:preprotein translocase subunit SecA